MPTFSPFAVLRALVGTGLLTSFIVGQGPTVPLTRAEATQWAETSRHADVMAFVGALEKLPYGARLQVRSFGRSGEERELPLVLVGNPPIADAAALRASKKLRLLVIGNIHAGEVEGKEALQMLLRELALGGYDDVLQKANLLIAPIYNADGNDRIDRRNRVSQNGPDGGVGQRPNAAGLDLNRDFVKAESPECRGLLQVFREYDPHLFMDLHTTNGSSHGYHLTYAPSLSPNVDPAIDHFARKTLLTEVRRKMADRGFQVFDYGNFPRRRGRSRRWVTYDHRPRFGTNYYGLRNRLSVLSEAFSYVSFADRIRVTRGFVIETLRTAVRHADTIRSLCRDADERASKGGSFGYGTSLAAPTEGEVLVGKLETRKIPGIGTRRIALDHRVPERMPVQVAFAAKESLAHPAAWAVLSPTKEVTRTLLRHGVRVERLNVAASVRGERFVPTGRRRLPRPFQGHRTLTLKGRYAAATTDLPPGTLVITARQPLARVAAQLLEAVSEDGLATWNFFDATITLAEEGAQRPGHYPVFRLSELPQLDTSPCKL